MPADYYTKSWTVPNSKKTLQIFFIDTVGIAPNHKSPALTGLPPANPDGSTSDLQKMYRQPQVDWLKAELAASTADYKIIAGHYHGISLSYCNISLCYITFSYIVYTVTDGDDVIPDMENILVPLMQKHGVIAYIHGHEHNAEVATPLLLLKDASLVRLQHIAWEGIHYVTVGHGCDKHDPLAAKPWTQKAAAGVKYAKTIGSFGVMRVEDAGLYFYFIDETGELMYHTGYLKK